MLGDISKAEHIYIACGYTDMRKSIDGLAAIVQQNFKLDPYKYLTTIFTYLPSQDLIKSPEIIDEFLPWSEFVQKNCK